jgi:hypothetical protein
VKVWSEIQPTSGAFVFEPGERYAVLASASLNYTLDQIAAKAASEGFTVTYKWETGQPSRATYAIDNWLASLAPDTTSNHRWVYAEGNFTGSSPWSLSQDPPWPFTMYHVAHVFEAVDAPDQPADSPAEPALPSTSTSAPASSGPSVVALAFGALLFGVAGYAAGVRFPWNPFRG